MVPRVTLTFCIDTGGERRKETVERGEEPNEGRDDRVELDGEGPEWPKVAMESVEKAQGVTNSQTTILLLDWFNYK